MRWDEFLDTADRLARGTTEGDWRSAASRAYYGVFHFFRDFLLAHRVKIGQGGASHFDVYSGLRNCGEPSMVLVANRINDLRQARTRADYDLGRTFSQGHALKSVQDASALAPDFRAVLSAVPAAQIAAGAKKYLQSIGHIP